MIRKGIKWSFGSRLKGSDPQRPTSVILGDYVWGLIRVNLRYDDSRSIEASKAIHEGDVAMLTRLLQQHPGLARARIVRSTGESHTLLHVVADWPGHYPNGADMVATLALAGADVNARFEGPHSETPLHWAASNNDVDLLDALIDAGADIEAPGAVIAGGTPLDDAVAFAQWNTAVRLAKRGASTALWHAAALGLMDRISRHFNGEPLPVKHQWAASASPHPGEVTIAFWCACHGGQRKVAAYLLERGADLNWVSTWDGTTPLDAACRQSMGALADWLRRRGAKLATELKDS